MVYYVLLSLHNTFFGYLHHYINVSKRAFQEYKIYVLDVVAAQKVAQKVAQIVAQFVARFVARFVAQRHFLQEERKKTKKINNITMVVLQKG